MGQLARMSRAERFCATFSAILLERIGSRLLVPPHQHGIEAMEFEQVREFVVLETKDGFRTFVGQYVWFEPDDSIDVVVERIEPVIHMLGIEKVASMLEEARLFDKSEIEQEVKRWKEVW